MTRGLRAFAAVVAREVAQRGPLMLAAALLGLLAWCAVWLPRARGFEDAEIRASAALLISALLLAGGVLALGASMMARDLTEGRLGFDYARPIPAWSLWGGRFTAVLLVLGAAIVLVWLPTLASGGDTSEASLFAVDWPQRVTTLRTPFLWHGGTTPWPWGTPWGALWLRPQTRAVPAPGTVLLVAVPLAVLLVHLAALALFSRSPWIAVDGLALLVAAALAASLAGRLSAHRAQGELFDVARLGVVVVLGAAFVAGWGQTATGRALGARAHRTASILFWGVLLSFLAVAEGRSRWLVAAGIDDLDRITYHLTPPRGEALVVAGSARGESGYAPVFVHHPAGRQIRKLDLLGALPAAPVFSADGTALAWRSCTPPGWPASWQGGAPRCEIRYADLRRPELEARDRAPIPAPSHGRVALALSGDGRRLALVDGERLAVYGMPAGRLLAAVRLPLPDVAFVPHFHTAERLRVHPLPEPGEPDAADLEIREFQLPERRWVTAGTVAGPWLRRSVDGQLLAAWSTLGARPRSVSIYRTDDLTELRRYPTELQVIEDLRFLAGGGVVLIGRRKPFDPRRRSHLEVWTAAGRLRFRTTFEGTLTLGNQLDDRRFWVGEWLEDGEDGSEDGSEDGGGQRHDRQWYDVVGASWTAHLLDLDTGETLHSEAGAVPAWHAAAAGSAPSRLLIGPRGELFTFDAERRERLPVLEPAP